MNQITAKLKGEGTTRIDDVDPIPRTPGAISALPYLIRWVRDGQYDMLDVVLLASWAVELYEGDRFKKHFVTLVQETIPAPLKVIMHVSPRVPRYGADSDSIKA